MTGACIANVMPATFGTSLQPDDLTALIDYLGSLK